MKSAEPLAVQIGNAGMPLLGGGLAGWLQGKLRRLPKAAPRLNVVERISLAPRQSLALIEADGRLFLAATSHEGPASLYPLDPEAGVCGMRPPQCVRKARRVL